MADATSRRERTRRRIKRGEQRKECSLTQELWGAFTHSREEVGRRRKILCEHTSIHLVNNTSYMAYLGINVRQCCHVISLYILLLYTQEQITILLTFVRISVGCHAHVAASPIYDVGAVSRAIYVYLRNVYVARSATHARIYIYSSSSEINVI